MTLAEACARMGLCHAQGVAADGTSVIELFCGLEPHPANSLVSVRKYEGETASEYHLRSLLVAMWVLRRGRN